ncbi:TPA: hypothetical protein N0F65_006849 [Lagenidium giganteum]|uniref:Uncharacterized protein n=1 Tax=Lagenidium giganteum TaxID=4803 RepID=A0AAV2ZCG0_9STRA|nr:TPA: hypothetical protein N0F65_006849 [Lagenidium giganteum]
MDTPTRDKQRRGTSMSAKIVEEPTDGLVSVSSVDVMSDVNSAVAASAEALNHAQHAAFSSLLGDRKRESDSDLHEDEDNDDNDDDDEDTARMLPIGEDEASLVQCAGMDQCFESWEDFHRAMEEYCIATHQPMRLRTSDSAKAVNSRAAKRNSLKEPIDETVGFVKKLYLCTHGVKTKPRGKGKRPRQHYRYMGCPAMIRACISERKPGEGPGKNKYVVRVVAQINKHNHRLSEHLFKSYSESRVVIDDELIVPINQNRLKDESMAPSMSGDHVTSSPSLPPANPMEDPAMKAAAAAVAVAAPAIFHSQPLDMMTTPRLKPRVGWIGCGIMGKSMCSHILSNGYEVSVYSRTATKCLELHEKGAQIMNSPLEVAQNSDIVFVIVGYPSDVRSVILDPQTGVLAGLKVGGVVVDMTTSEPSLAKEIYEAGKEKGISTLDAPVSGGDVGARDGTLSIMVGGDVDAVYVATPFFSLMGKNVRHMGGAGSGQHTKMVNQILIATNMIGVVEGLLYAKRSGLDMNEAIQAVSAGAAGSWSISNMGPRIAKRNFDPGFFVEHFLKDMGIALKEAERMDLSLPGLALAHQLYVAVKAQGHGRMGTQALMLALEQLNGACLIRCATLSKKQPDRQHTMMDAPDDELKQPLVAPDAGGGAPNDPNGSPMNQHAGAAPGEARSPKIGSSPKRGLKQKGPKHNSPHGHGPGQMRMQVHAPTPVRTTLEHIEEEEKESERTNVKQPLPYSAPNVHPYAVPQYQPDYYGGNKTTWGPHHLNESSGIPTIDIVFSGMYTLAAAFTMIQAFGMLIHFTFASVTLGLYTMAFGATVILYDLKSVVNGVSVEMYFPFLGNYIGRAITIFFFAVLCGQTYEYAGWTKFIILYNTLVATLQGFVYFTTKTVSPVEPQMEDLPDI